MNTEKIFWIGLGGIALVLAAILVFLFLGNNRGPLDSGDPAPDQQATSTPEDTAGNETGSGAGSNDTNATSTRPSKIAKPTIPTSPYTVYIGFAAQVGTSSAELMNKAVGEAVVGYEWEALPWSQVFDSVVLPDWDEQGEYEVLVWETDEEGKNGSYTSLGTFSEGDTVQFPREGFAGALRFKVLGIDPALRICPGDRSFNWQAAFTFEGNLGLVRTPITKKLPAGELCELRS